jgi:uncharacterized membrane protein (UPF0127 family)
MRKLLIVGVVILIFWIFIYDLTPRPHLARRGSQTQSVHKTNQITIHNTTFTVAIADTDVLRTQGLSDTQTVPHDGMLFVFEKPGPYGFWMKDMQYPIDIIWIDSSKRVIGVVENLLPTTYPATVTPPFPAQYVLETKAFWAQAHTVKIGDSISW